MLCTAPVARIKGDAIFVEQCVDLLHSYVSKTSAIINTHAHENPAYLGSEFLFHLY